MDHDDAHLKRAQSVCAEMFATRGYTFYSRADDCWILGKSHRPPVFVFFVLTSLNMNVATHYYTLIASYSIRHCVFVHAKGITVSTLTVLKTIPARIELFSLDELQFNITTHALVPPHTKVKKNSKVSCAHYPIIRTTDPIVRFYGFEVGDVIRIARPEGIAFRVVR